MKVVVVKDHLKMSIEITLFISALALFSIQIKDVIGKASLIPDLLNGP